MLGIPSCGRNQPNIQLGTTQQKSQRPNIVNVRADVSIKDNGNRHYFTLKLAGQGGYELRTNTATATNDRCAGATPRVHEMEIILYRHLRWLGLDFVV